MRTRALLVVIALAAGLGACTDEDLFGDIGAPAPNGCTSAGCPQAASFCTARGYQPGTDGYDRCLVSVEENLRKGQ
ncbi:MAG TPA: hypothetical protein VMU08_05520 [Rhizomicrobium sp.]|nr:hypothetical protein [Rhizomicrobium sp.]